jgi:Nickel responsive protein SCO4226-like
MDLYMIMRRRGWDPADDLSEVAERSRRVGEEEMPTELRWIRSYVVEEDDGSLGSICIYEATSEEAIREHSRRALLPTDEIMRISETIVVRSDPQPAAA